MSLSRFSSITIFSIFAMLPAICSAQLGQKVLSKEDLKKLEAPDESTLMRESSLIDEVLEPQLIFRIDPSRSKIIRTKLPITRIAVTDPQIVETNEFDQYEIEIIGKKAGETTLTIWFLAADNTTTALRYLVKVDSDQSEQQQAEIEFHTIQHRLNEYFPNSQIMLNIIGDKLIVRGQPRDSKEAAEILSILRSGGAAAATNGNQNVTDSTGVMRLPGIESLSNFKLVDLLHVPGEHQVMLKVRIAELTRSAARELGVDFSVLKTNIEVTQTVGGVGNLSAILDGGDYELFLRAFSSNGNSKILAEPTLVTISGQPATFLAGGEFAVPTAVGVGGIGAVSTNFRGFGTQLSFTPTVIDKDKIRLRVAPSFSSLNKGNSVDGIPGVDTRTVTTTVDLREGQWLAIAGLIQESQAGSHGRLPFLGDIPGAGFLGRQQVKKEETELVVLVSPELVHPMEPEEVPLLLPGMEVTDPTDHAFYFRQRIEGDLDVHHRSTIWSAMKKDIRRGNIETIHANKAAARYHHGQTYYLNGPQGFSE